MRMGIQNMMVAVLVVVSFFLTSSNSKLTGRNGAYQVGEHILILKGWEGGNYV
jgi:hypothetical protein